MYEDFRHQASEIYFKGEHKFICNLTFKKHIFQIKIRAHLNISETILIHENICYKYKTY